MNEKMVCFVHTAEERAKPKKHIAIPVGGGATIGTTCYKWLCPTCRSEITGYSFDECKICGQKLDCT